jgi:hypothetical protein
MKLILHIGTSKTGTTALQEFLAMNSAPLAEYGVYYAAPLSLADYPSANAIANALGNGNEYLVRDFFETHVNQAHRKNARMMIVSAENFYGMSTISALRRRVVCNEALNREHYLIARLRTILPDGVFPRIACYFRSPDRFAESWYNQHIKGSSLFSGDFGAFLKMIAPILYYDRYIGLWASTFGRENCFVGSYEVTRGNIIADFMSKIVGVGDLSIFSSVRRRSNDRLSRDLLEFKRIINRGLLPAEKGLEYRIFSQLKNIAGLVINEPDTYQDFFSPRERADLLERLAIHMEALYKTYNVPRFVPFDMTTAETTSRPYPGLSAERRHELERAYNCINRRIGFRIERFAKRSAFRLRARFPRVETGLDFLRRAGVRSNRLIRASDV